MGTQALKDTERGMISFPSTRSHDVLWCAQKRAHPCYQYGGDDQHGEIFADMFLHWVYGEWNPVPFQISEDEVLYGQGGKKAEFMNKNMAGSIFLAFR